MKIFFLLFPFLLACSLAYGQLDEHYSRFQLFKGVQVEKSPVWGKNDRYLYVKFEDGWRKYDLKKAFVQEVEYKTTAILDFKGYSLVKDSAMIRGLNAKEALNTESVKDKQGRGASIESDGHQYTLWAEYENDYMEEIDISSGSARRLALSPSEKYLAFTIRHGDNGVCIFDVGKAWTRLKRIFAPPIEHFKLSTRQVSAKRLVGKWRAEPAQLLLAEDAGACFEYEFRQKRSSYIDRPTESWFTIEFLADGRYQITGNGQTYTGTWRIEAGKIVVQETERVFVIPFVVDMGVRTPRIALIPRSGKPFIIVYLLSRCKS